VTVAAALGIAVFREAMFWAFDTTALIDLAILILIVGILLLQRGQLARTDEGTTGTWAANVEIRGIPHELKDVPSVRAGKRRFLYALAIAVIAYPWVMSPSQNAIGAFVMLNGIVVVSLVVLTGWGGQISLGQYAFVATGGLVGGSLMTKVGLPFLPSLVLASFAGAGVAVLIGLPAMRIKGLFLAVTTLAFAVTMTTVFLNPRFFGWLQPERITRPKFLFIDSEDPRVFFYLSVVALLFALWVAHGLRNSRAGRVLIAMRENERTAQSYSINRVRTRLATFAISGFLAAFAGVLLGAQAHEVRADVFGPGASLNIFLVAVTGGLGSIGGSLTGLGYFAALNILVDDPLWRGVLQAAGVIGVIMFYPGGFGGLFFLLRDAWLRRVAMRQRIFVPSLIGDYRVLDGEQQRVALAPKFAGDGHEEEVPVVYRIPSAIGVRGESQQGHRWRYQ
jgi:branched-chain amino acid transport system permease protein